VADRALIRSSLIRVVALALAAATLGGCADSKAVNAAFRQNRVTWYLLDPARPDGLRLLAGFEQATTVQWVPRSDAVLPTDLAPGTRPGMGAAAVQRLGLLVLDDSTGDLAALRPGARFPLDGYRTDRLFSWKGKIFLTLAQDEAPGAEPALPPATLAWWEVGQERMALYPIPSQVREPGRQAVGVAPPEGASTRLAVTWRVPAASGWTYERTSFNLADGSESPALEGVALASDPAQDPAFAAPRTKLAERLGAAVPVRAALGPGPSLLFTEAGWVAVAKAGAGAARLYRLPELGAAGRYTGALSLTTGWVFSWETDWRGYAGASGFVHVPFAVLAP